MSLCCYTAKPSRPNQDLETPQSDHFKELKRGDSQSKFVFPLQVELLLDNAMMVVHWHLVAPDDRAQLLSVIDHLEEDGTAGSRLVAHEAHHLKQSVTNIISLEATEQVNII